MHRECRGRPPPDFETASKRSRHASRHMRQARAVMHVGIAYLWWQEKCSRHSHRLRNPQYYVSGKRPWNQDAVTVLFIKWLDNLSLALCLYRRDVEIRTTIPISIFMHNFNLMFPTDSLLFELRKTLYGIANNGSDLIWWWLVVWLYYGNGVDFAGFQKSSPLKGTIHHCKQSMFANGKLDSSIFIPRCPNNSNLSPFWTMVWCHHLKWWRNYWRCNTSPKIWKYDHWLETDLYACIIANIGAFVFCHKLTLILFGNKLKSKIHRCNQSDKNIFHVSTVSIDGRYLGARASVGTVMTIFKHCMRTRTLMINMISRGKGELQLVVQRQ